MIRLRLILAFVSMAFSAAIFAKQPDWKPIGANEKAAVLIDAANLQRQGPLITVWIMFSFPSVQSSLGAVKYRSFKALSLLRCDDNTIDELSDIFYSAAMGGGNVVASHDWPGGAGINYIVPGSFQDSVKDAVCP